MTRHVSPRHCSAFDHEAHRLPEVNPPRPCRLRVPSSFRLFQAKFHVSSTFRARLIPKNTHNNVSTDSQSETQSHKQINGRYCNSSNLGSASHSFSPRPPADKSCPCLRPDPRSIHGSLHRLQSYSTVQRGTWSSSDVYSLSINHHLSQTLTFLQTQNQRCSVFI